MATAEALSAFFFASLFLSVLGLITAKLTTPQEMFSQFEALVPVTMRWHCVVLGSCVSGVL